MTRLNRLPGFPEWEGIAAVCGEPLCRHCTFRIGGNADVALFPATPDQLIRALDLSARNAVKIGSLRQKDMDTVTSMLLGCFIQPDMMVLPSY